MKDEALIGDQFRGRMLSPKTVADAVEASEFTIHRWIRSGKIKAIKLSSRCTRIDGNSLANFIDAKAGAVRAKEAQPEHLKRQGGAA